MRQKVESTLPKIHWSTWISDGGGFRGYLDGWQYGLPDFSCEAQTMDELKAILSDKLDEWKGKAA
jgi:hypothetical protein